MLYQIVYPKLGTVINCKQATAHMIACCRETSSRKGWQYVGSNFILAREVTLRTLSLHAPFAIAVNSVDIYL